MALDPSLLADAPAFAGLTVEALDDVLADARSVQVCKGETVFSQGDSAERFYLLLHGRLRVTRLDGQGQQIVVRFVSPGELFGIAMALRLDAYPATVTAAVDSVVLAWPNAAWAGLVARHPALAHNTMATIGGRLQDSHTRVLEMSTQQVERRIAQAVLRLANQAGRKTEHGILIDFPISRQDIAEMTGTTLHTVSRTLSGWEDQGLIEGGRQRIVVRDPHRLVMLAERPD
jgi:CRP-like cAMP-binding protein